MKTCPDCAEEIQDAAIKCRFCGRDLRPRVPIAKGLVFTHVGETYMFGASLATREYAIWNRQGGKPIQRFPATPKGWEKGYAAFTAMEPVHAEASTGAACPNCGSSAVQPITAADKAASAGLVGVFALGKMTKSYECASCNYRW